MNQTETTESYRMKFVIGPATKMFVVIACVMLAAGLVAPGVVTEWLAQRNVALFGSMHLWTLITGALVIFDLQQFMLVLCFVLFIIRQVEQNLRPKWFWVFWFTTTSAAMLLAWLLAPEAPEAFPGALVPGMAGCGALWWLCRGERWNVWGIEMKARTGIVITVAAGSIIILISGYFRAVAVCLAAFGAGYAVIRWMEWHDNGGLAVPHSKTKPKQHYIELD